jgi:hypothetical protein
MYERLIKPLLNYIEQSIKPVLNHILLLLTGKWADLRIEYGILASAACIAVPLKLLLFYKLIGVSANFFFVWLITAVLTYFLFASFKNKWIPAVVYLLLSVLMFCDVTYSSFFNRYLSVNMLGAAGFLGDITASIKEVLKPWFFLVLADALLIVAVLVVRYLRTRKEKACEGIQDIEDSHEEPPTSNMAARKARRERKKFHDRLISCSDQFSLVRGRSAAKEIGQTCCEILNKVYTCHNFSKNDTSVLFYPSSLYRRGRCNYHSIYEEKFGPIPKGYIIFHKDGNMWNDDPDNLEAISRAELLKRNLENR